MPVHLFYFRPSSLIRIWFHCLAGYRLCRRYSVPFRKYFPECLNSMTTAWNFSRLNLPPAGTILDVGANNSQMAKLLLLASPGADLYSFEPLSRCRPLGKVYHIALSDENKTGTMYGCGGDTYGAALDNESAEHDFKETVEVRRFDSLGIHMRELRKPVLLKIDVEGHEMQVLKGFGDCLASVDAILMEIQNTQYEGAAPDASEVYGYLRERGFKRSKMLFAWFDGPRPPAYSDVLFWHEGHSPSEGRAG